MSEDSKSAQGLSSIWLSLPSLQTKSCVKLTFSKTSRWPTTSDFKAMFRVASLLSRPRHSRYSSWTTTLLRSAFKLRRTTKSKGTKSVTSVKNVFWSLIWLVLCLSRSKCKVKMELWELFTKAPQFGTDSTWDNLRTLLTMKLKMLTRLHSSKTLTQKSNCTRLLLTPRQWLSSDQLSTKKRTRYLLKCFHQIRRNSRPGLLATGLTWTLRKRQFCILKCLSPKQQQALSQVSIWRSPTDKTLIKNS